MSRNYQKPENALKRANEFIDVGKPTRALEVLYEVIKRGKMRTNYSEKLLEPIMFKYLELCVDLKKSHLAKEGLYQYRNIFQSVNVSSLETVVRFYLHLADERTESARKESHQAVVEIDDLDNLATPEEILLSAVSGEDAQDRSDRTILTPWVKFLWESYRQCLELLRTNSRVERLYHDIAKHAFKFCEKYNRKTEFRKLCDNLRTHLSHIQKQQGSATAVNLNNPETQQMNLETRLEQLNFAIKMELWQEAYKAIEDISDLMNKSKKMPKPHVMASYYQKLALVFWKAGNQLFHAAALFKLFQLLREQKKNITADEVSKRASVVLIATLAIPLPSAHPEFDRFIETEKSALEKIDKLAVLLSLPKPPTRASLIRDLVRLNVVSSVPQELQKMYQLMEQEFDPLNLCKRMKVHFDWISEKPESGLPQYIPALQEMTTTRLIKQVAQVYQTITFLKLLELTVFMTPFHLEKVLVDLVRHNDLQIRIDHRRKCVHFGVDLSESQREDLSEGPTLQTLPSETIRCQLVHMSSALQKCLSLILPESKKKEMEPVRLQTIQSYEQTKEYDHQRLLQRQHIIEERKEMLENQNLEREERIKQIQEEQLKRQKAEENERLEREAIKRERERQEEQLKQIHTKQIKDKLMQIGKTSYGQRMIEKIDKEELLNLGPEEILQRQVEELEKERKEMQKKLKSQEKSLDFFERARRILEVPRLKKSIDVQKEKDKEFWQLQEEERVRKLIEEHGLALEHSRRLKRMMGDRDAFIEKLKSSRLSEVERKLNDFNARLEVQRRARLAERKEQRHKERRDAYIRQKAEEEQQRLDEQLKKEREEARLESERMEMEEEEREARYKGGIEKHEKVEKEETVQPWRRPKEGSEWQKKEQDKMAAWRASEEKEKDSFDRKGPEMRRDEREDKWRNSEEKRSLFVSRDIRRDDWAKKAQQEKEEKERETPDKRDEKVPPQDGWRGSEERASPLHREKDSPVPDRKGSTDIRRDDGDSGPRDRRSGDDRDQRDDRDRSPPLRGGNRRYSPPRDMRRGGSPSRDNERGPPRNMDRSGPRDSDRYIPPRDRDRDVRGPPRDREFTRDFGRDRDRGDFGRDRDRGDFGRDRDRGDFGRDRGDRDRDFGRGDFGRDGRDRGGGGGFRDSKFGGRGDRDLDDRRGPSRADEGGSWRRGPEPPSDRRDDRGDRGGGFRRDEPNEWRGGGDGGRTSGGGGSGGGGRTTGGGSSWRDGSKRDDGPPQRRGDDNANRPTVKEPSNSIREGPDENGWQTVKKRE